jgi:hypothetical protein
MALSYHSSLIARLMCYITSMMKHTKQLMISMNQWDMLNTAAMERHKMAVRPRTVGKHRGLSIFTNNTLPPISISAAYRVQSSTSSLLHVRRVYRESTNTVANRGIADYYPVPSPTLTLRLPRICNDVQNQTRHLHGMSARARACRGGALLLAPSNPQTRHPYTFG